MSNHYRALLLGMALALIGAVIYRAIDVGIMPGSFILAGFALALTAIATINPKPRTH